jgi:hypothetical protein
MWGGVCSYGGDIGELASILVLGVSTALWGGGSGGFGVGGGVGTLLGPEGTNPFLVEAGVWGCSGWSFTFCCRTGPRVGVGCGGWVWVVVG